MKYFVGSPDMVMTMMLEHILDLPKDLLDIYYSIEKLYFVNKNQQTVGILNFNPKQGMISNIGVDPTQRRKDYGRQIMLFGLKHLKTAGCKKAALRFHIENKPAIHLYEPLGFAVKKRRKTLIWKNHITSSTLERLE